MPSPSAAVDAPIGTDLPTPADTGSVSDPGMKAGQCLGAVPHLVPAVALASAGLG